MNDFLDVLIARLMIWRIKKGYGADCESKDMNDLPIEFQYSARCASCRARETIDWLEDHIRLIEDIK